MTDFPDLKLKALVTFPSTVIGGVGLTATRYNGAVTLDYAWQEFGSISAIPTSPTSYILTYDTQTNAYVMVPSHLLGGAVAGISDAPNDGVQYGRQSTGWTPIVGGGGGPSPSNATPQQDGTAIPGASLLYARGDHVHPTDPLIALKAPLASPVFTGDPKAPTPTFGDSDTSLATTAFVQAAVAAVGSGTTLPPSTTSTVNYLLQSNGASLAPTWNGFVQPGSANVRTWQNKAADTVSILDFLDEADFAARPGSITVSGTGKDCSSAFTSAWASGAGKRVIIPPGNYRLGSSKVFDGTVTFDFMPGAVICPDNGVSVEFRNPIYASVRRIFGNNGHVIGIRSVMPEWWGANAVDGLTSATAAIQNAIYCGEHASNSLGHYLLTFQSGTYSITSQLTFNMDNADWMVQGAGHSTLLVAAASASGTCIYVIGTGSHNYKISDFVLINQTAGSGFVNGFVVQTPGDHRYSLFTNVGVSGFACNWNVPTPTRLVKWDRCSAGNNAQSGITSGATNVLIKTSTPGDNSITPDPAIGFVGDLDFFSCEWTSDYTSTPVGSNVRLEGSANAAHVSGIRFIGNIFYFGKTSFVIAMTNAADCDDIWIESCQFEGANSSVETNAVNLSCDGTFTDLRGNQHGHVLDIHINHNYFAGYGYSYHIKGRCSGGSTPNGNWFITNNFFNHATTTSVFIDATGSTFTGYVHNGNIHRDCSASQDINTLINMYYITCTGNTISGATTSNRFFATGAGGDWHILTGNNSAGRCTTPYSIGVANQLSHNI